MLEFISCDQSLPTSVYRMGGLYRGVMAWCEVLDVPTVAVIVGILGARCHDSGTTYGINNSVLDDAEPKESG